LSELQHSTLSTQHSALVIGGGLAGLTAGLHLAERGLKPLILEANPDFWGGRVAGKSAITLTDPTGKEWQFPAEHGLHGIWWQYKNVKAMLTHHKILPKLVLAERQQWVHGEKGKVKKAEMGRVVTKTVIWPAPFHYGALFFRPSFLRMLTPRDVLAIPSVLGSLLVATGVDPLLEGRALQGRTLADFCKGWPPRITAFVASLARSGLSAHPDEVPLAGFIAFLRFYTLLRRDSQKFHYLAADPETALIGPMVRKIQELGGQVRLGCRVERLERWNETGWQVFSDKGETFQTQHVILATDAPVTRQILSNSPATQEIAANLSWPQGLETAVVRFWFSAPPAKKAAEAGIVSGDFAIDNFFWLHRIQDIFAEWHTATGGSAIEAHIYSQQNLALDDQTLLTRAQNDLSRIFPDLKGKIIHSTLQRNSPSHTLFGVGSLSQHMGVHTPWPGLLCCGDWVRHPLPALFLERATATGIVAANAVLESNGKPPFPLQKYDKPEFLSRVMGGWMGSMRGTKRIGLRTKD